MLSELNILKQFNFWLFILCEFWFWMLRRIFFHIYPLCIQKPFFLQGFKKNNCWVRIILHTLLPWAHVTLSPVTWATPQTPPPTDIVCLPWAHVALAPITWATPQTPPPMLFVCPEPILPLLEAVAIRRFWNKARLVNSDYGWWNSLIIFSLWCLTWVRVG